ncbi:hypothetical protein LTR37_007355 [Vermiconidia calcicola]|uniref:Uncharacterized protein n=1 Tax=Vermiconidia calcicola TaxID=1690605 RepID=A0ACC3NE12_9PEZI|nr:hypothetical protein LTR37_007355 [Vermiconidia calcicola]
MTDSWTDGIRCPVDGRVHRTQAEANDCPNRVHHKHFDYLDLLPKRTRTKRPVPAANTEAQDEASQQARSPSQEASLTSSSPPRAPRSSRTSSIDPGPTPSTQHTGYPTPNSTQQVDKGAFTTPTPPPRHSTSRFQTTCRFPSLTSANNIPDTDIMTPAGIRASPGSSTNTPISASHVSETVLDGYPGGVVPTIEREPERERAATVVNNFEALQQQQDRELADLRTRNANLRENVNESRALINRLHTRTIIERANAQTMQTQADRARAEREEAFADAAAAEAETEAARRVQRRYQGMLVVGVLLVVVWCVWGWYNRAEYAYIRKRLYEHYGLDPETGL